MSSKVVADVFHAIGGVEESGTVRMESGEIEFDFSLEVSKEEVITFSKAFTKVLYSNATLDRATTTILELLAGVKSITTTQMTIQCYRLLGTIFSENDVKVHWIVIGKD